MWVKTDFPINAMLKLGEQFQATCFDREKRYTHKKFTKIWSGTNKNFRRKKFLMNCRRVIWIIIFNVQQYKWLEIEHWTLAGPRPLLLQNLFVASKCPHTSLFSCCLMFVPFIVLQCLDAFFNDPMPSVSFKTIVVPSLGSGLGSSASSGALGFWILKRLSNKISWSWELSNSKTSRALQVLIYCPWLNILIMEVDNLSVKKDLSQGITECRKLLNEASTDLTKTQAHVQTVYNSLV